MRSPQESVSICREISVTRSMRFVKQLTGTLWDDSLSVCQSREHSDQTGYSILLFQSHQVAHSIGKTSLKVPKKSFVSIEAKLNRKLAWVLRMTNLWEQMESSHSDFLQICSMVCTALCLDLLELRCLLGNFDLETRTG